METKAVFFLPNFVENLNICFALFQTADIKIANYRIIKIACVFTTLRMCIHTVISKSCMGNKQFIDLLLCLLHVMHYLNATFNWYSLHFFFWKYVSNSFVLKNKRSVKYSTLCIFCGRVRVYVLPHALWELLFLAI